MNDLPGPQPDPPHSGNDSDSDTVVGSSEPRRARSARSATGTTPDGLKPPAPPYRPAVAEPGDAENDEYEPL
jgi:hypothetical protein